MAFEAYLRQATMQPRRGRRVTYTVSAAVHVAAVLGAVAYSFWHVEEVTPRTVSVTFVSAAAVPPPPPPPPPLGGGSATPKHKVVVRPKVEGPPKITDVVQPKVEPVKEPPKDETKAESTDSPAGPGTATGVKGGVVGGVKGGIVGGTVGGAGTAQRAPTLTPKPVPPHIGAQQMLSGEQPDFPAFLRRSGANYLVMAKICVATSGAVESVTLVKRADPTLDNNVAARVKTWRFRPLMANGTPIPFCYFGRFEFKSE